MTARQQRRAAERRALKLERKRNQLTAPAAPDEAALFSEPKTQENAERRARKLERKRNQLTAPAALDEAAPLSEHSSIRAAINRANAQLSTGPKTPGGKATSSLNAVKTGLTGRTVVLPTDDAAAYEQHVLAYQNEWQPVGQRESDLVQSLADIQWRLNRIPGLEMAIYARGRVQFDGCFDDQDVTLRPGLIELETFITYEKQLRNLHLQESRLNRQREKFTAELRQLQEDRKKDEQSETEAAALNLTSKQAQAPFSSTGLGFEFSTVDIESDLDHVPDQKTHLAAA